MAPRLNMNDVRRRRLEVNGQNPHDPLTLEELQAEFLRNNPTGSGRVNPHIPASDPADRGVLNKQGSSGTTGPFGSTAQGPPNVLDQIQTAIAESANVEARRSDPAPPSYGSGGRAVTPPRASDTAEIGRSGPPSTPTRPQTDMNRTGTRPARSPAQGPPNMVDQQASGPRPQTDRNRVDPRPPASPPPADRFRFGSPPPARGAGYNQGPPNRTSQGGQGPLGDRNRVDPRSNQPLGDQNRFAPPTPQFADFYDGPPPYMFTPPMADFYDGPTPPPMHGTSQYREMPPPQFADFYDGPNMEGVLNPQQRPVGDQNRFGPSAESVESTRRINELAYGPDAPWRTDPYTGGYQDLRDARAALAAERGYDTMELQEYMVGGTDTASTDAGDFGFSREGNQRVQHGGNPPISALRSEQGGPNQQDLQQAIMEQYNLGLDAAMAPLPAAAQPPLTDQNRFGPPPPEEWLPRHGTAGYQQDPRFGLGPIPETLPPHGTSQYQNEDVFREWLKTRPTGDSTGGDSTVINDGLSVDGSDLSGSSTAGGAYQDIANLQQSKRDALTESYEQTQSDYADAEDYREGQITQIADDLTVSLTDLENERVDIQTQISDATKLRGDEALATMEERQQANLEKLGQIETTEYNEVTELIAGLTGSQVKGANDTMNRLAQVANTAGAGRLAIPAKQLSESMLVLSDEMFGLTTALDKDFNDKMAMVDIEEQEMIMKKREADRKARAAAAAAAAKAAESRFRWEAEMGLKVQKAETDLMKWEAEFGIDVRGMELEEAEFLLGVEREAAGKRGRDANVNTLAGMQSTYTAAELGAMTDSQLDGVWDTVNEDLRTFNKLSNMTAGSVEHFLLPVDEGGFGYDDPAIVQNGVAWAGYVQGASALEEDKEIIMAGFTDDQQGAWWQAPSGEEFWFYDEAAINEQMAIYTANADQIQNTYADVDPVTGTTYTDDWSEVTAVATTWSHYHTLIDTQVDEIAIEQPFEGSLYKSTGRHGEPTYNYDYYDYIMSGQETGPAVSAADLGILAGPQFR